MNEQELSQRLGVANFYDLKKIIVEQTTDIRENQIVFHKDKKYLELPKLPKAKVNEHLSEFKGDALIKLFPKNQKLKKIKIMGWRAILKVNPATGIDYSPLIKVKEVIPDKTVIKNDLDHGHLLANQFEKYIRINGCFKHSNGTGTKFSSKKNEMNILPQFKKANEGEKGERWTQSDFEKEVSDWLENDKKHKAEVYYEVQPIFLEKDDLMPIGNRILAINLKNSDQSFHVFVPNYSDDIREEYPNLTYKNYRNMFLKLSPEK